MSIWLSTSVTMARSPLVELAKASPEHSTLELTTVMAATSVTSEVVFWNSAQPPVTLEFSKYRDAKPLPPRLLP